MKAKMATKEQSSVTIRDAFVNKLRDVRDLENNPGELQIVRSEWLAKKWFWGGNSAKIYL